MKYKNIFFAIVCSLPTSFSASADLSALFTCKSMPQNPTTIELSDNSLTCAERTILISDFQYLENLKLQKHDPELAKLLEVEKVTSENLMEWLQKRITYIYSAGRGNSGFVSNSSMAVFENPFIPFTDHVAVPKLGIGAQAKFLGIWQAENIGSESYAQAKQNGVAYDFESPEGKTIPVLSPRVGLISVSGLFAPQFYPNPMLLKTEANSIYRLGVLFHEARHSDGSGRHLGFPHNLCPEGHDYAGQSACDDTLNGAYTVGAHVMNELMMNCKDCSEEDLSSLQSSIHNDLQRVNKEIPVSEYAVNETMAACKKVKEAAESSPFEMKFSQKLILDDCPLAIEFQNKIRRAEWVDPAPEFLKLRSPILMMDNSAP